MRYGDDGKRISEEQREKIYSEIWSEPVSKVAPRYGISDTAFRKRCVECWDIPVPEVGYWAKKRAGKDVQQPELPQYPSDEAKFYVYGYTVSFKDFSKLPAESLYSEEELFPFSNKTRELLKSIAGRTDLCDRNKKSPSEIREAYKAWKKEGKTSALSDRAVRILSVLNREIRDLEGFVSAEFGTQGTSIDGTVYACEQDFAFRISLDKDQQQLSIAMQWQKWWGSYDGKKPNDLSFTDLAEQPLEKQIGNVIYRIFVLAGRHWQEEEIERRKEQKRREELAFQQKIAPFVEEENQKVGKALEDAENYQKACTIREYAEAYYRKKADQFDENPELKAYYDWLVARADWIDPLVENDYEALLKRLDGK